METIQNIFQAQIFQMLGWTLIHFVWQGLAIGLILAIVLKMSHKSTANLRYIIACAALILVVLMPAVTIRTIGLPVEPVDQPKLQALFPEVVVSTEAVTEIPQPATPPLPSASIPNPPLTDRLIARVNSSLPFIVTGWLIGVFGLSLWHLGGWTQLQRLRKRMVKHVTPPLEAKLQQLSNALHIQKTIGIMESALVQVPTVVGHLKPVILLPASALTGLSTEQIQAILAHELAHIKRHDYLVNILQTVVEILGFYHPAVWWISRKIRLERENACDDIAVSLCTNKLSYAKALTTMEQIRATQPTLAIAASGGNLFQRIKRLLPKDQNQVKQTCLPSIIAILMIAALLIPTTLALSGGKNKPAEAKNDTVRVYQVNRDVSDFPETEDFSTPESAYAAINRVMAADDYQGWQRVSVKKLTKSLAKEAKRKNRKKVTQKWSTACLNAQILEVRIKGDTAAVFAKFQGKSTGNPIDYRHLELEDGKWLNTGEDRYDSIEQAREKFTYMIERKKKADDEKSATEKIYSQALENPEMLKGMAEELFDKLRKANYEKILSYYNEKTGKWKRDGWKKLGLDYRVHTDWPRFAIWVCKTFKDNPIKSVKLGEVFVSDKQLSKDINAPAIPYRLLLQDGAILDGELYFDYSAKSKKWQAAEGIDWHLQKKPAKKSQNEQSIQISVPFEILKTELEPVAQGKNVLWITVENTTDKIKYFSVNVYSRSVDYGTQGVGWGTNFYEKFNPKETKKLRYAYKIQGPITENTYVRLNFYNAKSLIHDENRDMKHFIQKFYKSNDLKRRLPETSQSVSDKDLSKTIIADFTNLQNLIKNKKYDDAFNYFSKDYKKSEYQIEPLKRFKRSMEPTHPLHSAFTWDKNQFLKLKPKQAQINKTKNKITLSAVYEKQTWKITFIKETDQWKIDDITGYRPKVLDMQEADNNTSKSEQKNNAQPELSKNSAKADVDKAVSTYFQNKAHYLKDQIKSRMQAIELIKKHPEAIALPHLIDHFNSENPEHRTTALHIFSCIKWNNPAIAVKPLRALLTDPNKQIVTRAIIALAALQDKASFDTFEKIANDRNTSKHVRNRAIFALSDLDDPRSIQILKNLAATESGQVKGSAEDAILKYEFVQDHKHTTGDERKVVDAIALAVNNYSPALVARAANSIRDIDPIKRRNLLDKAWTSTLEKNRTSNNCIFRAAELLHVTLKENKR